MKRLCVVDSSLPPLNNEFEWNLRPQTWKKSLSALLLVMVFHEFSFGRTNGRTNRRTNRRTNQCVHYRSSLRTWSTWGPNCWNGPYLVLISRKKSHFPNYKRKVAVKLWKGEKSGNQIDKQPTHFCREMCFNENNDLGSSKTRKMDPHLVLIFLEKSLFLPL